MHSTLHLLVHNFVNIGLHPNACVVISNPLIHLQTSNQTLSMKCIPDTKSVNYTWEKKCSTLPSRAQRVNTSNLIIVNIKPEDSGEYRCVISNSTGRLFSKYESVAVKGKSFKVQYICINNVLLAILNLAVLL